MAAKLEELLGSGSTPGVVQWLVREMRENRRSPFPPEQMAFWKDYREGHCPGCEEKEEATGDPNAFHAPRGPAAWVQEYILPREPLSDKEGEACFCKWPGDAYPSPLIVKELTGKPVSEHFRWRDEHGK